MPADDEAFKVPAESTRRALREMGVWARDCLPGEADHKECGGSWAEHFCANLAALKAIIDHQLAHLDPSFVAAVFPLVYDDWVDKLEALDRGEDPEADHPEGAHADQAPATESGHAPWGHGHTCDGDHRPGQTRCVCACGYPRPG